MTNKMQLCRIIFCSLTALHVSSDIFPHRQEHHNCNYSYDVMDRSQVTGKHEICKIGKFIATLKIITAVLIRIIVLRI
jgi:hypothetical protein